MHPFLMYSQQYYGTLYQWGYNMKYCERLDCLASDCSGFVLRVLSDSGLLLPDMTSQGLYNYCLKHGKSSGFEPGNLLFFGKSTASITHVSIYMGDGYMVESGGAGKDSLKMSKADLINKSACVRIKRVDNRNDLVSSIKLEVKNV